MAAGNRSKPKAPPKSSSTKNPAEGTAWTVPLPKGGYGTVVVARAGESLVATGQVFGYILPTRSATLPKPAQVAGLRPQDAGAVLWLPVRPFRNNRWKPIGPVAKFSHREWPVPPLVMRDDHGRHALQLYDDQASPSVLANEQIHDPDAAAFPEVNWTKTLSQNGG